MGAVYAAAFAAALVGALLATPLARKVALRLDIVDMPAARKVHTDPIPYLGGLAIILAFVAAMVLGVVVHPLAGSYKQVAAILGGGLVLAGMGLVDDLKVVPGWIKVPLEIVAGLGLYAAGVAAHPFKNVVFDLPPQCRMGRRHHERRQLHGQHGRAECRRGRHRSGLFLRPRRAVAANPRRQPRRGAHGVRPGLPLVEPAPRPHLHGGQPAACSSASCWLPSG